MPMRILVLNGPNLNMLGKRETRHYGAVTLKAIEQELTEEAKKLGFETVFFQSNHEGGIIDFIQKEASRCQGILINPGALTHYSYGLYDALVDAGLPVVEVHMTNIFAREDWRRSSFIAPITVGQVVGFKERSYFLGLEALAGHIKGRA
jgi:3-dehydroquinate dehydratase-2